MAARSDASRVTRVRDLSLIMRRARGGAVAPVLEQLPILLERVRVQGMVGQEHAKTRAGTRTIAIPRELVDLLHQRREQYLWASGFVFPTVRGTLRDPRNTSRDWREARERLGSPTVTTQSFRKTVAMALDQAGLTAREITEHLGHEHPSITQDVHMANTGGRRAAAALDGLLGGRQNPRT